MLIVTLRVAEPAFLPFKSTVSVIDFDPPLAYVWLSGFAVP